MTTARPAVGRPPKHYDWATEYAKKVVSGEIIASKKNIQVAKRHLDEINLKVLNYHWKPEKASHVIRFIEKLPDTKTGKPMPLMLFQKFIVGSLYGWVDKDGNRRFTKAYISMARKQGKSILSSGIALYELLFGKSPAEGREIYISSYTLSQAKTIYNMAYRQLNIIKANSKTLRNRLEMRKTDIVDKPSDSKMMALSNNPDAVDGKNPAVVLLDELASVPDDEMYSRLKTGMGLQENPLTLLISTASDNLTSPMFEEYQYITRLLNGEIKNDRYFVFCAEMDSEEEIENEGLWMKAMPLLENKKHRPTILKNIRQDIEEQREKGETTKILIKNFNLWQATNEKNYLSLDRWEACRTDKQIDITGTDAFVGLDLSKIHDLSAFSFIHMLENKKMYVDTHAFVSTVEDIEVKSKRDKIDYMKLAQEGYVTMSNNELSGIIDYEQMIEWLLEYEKKHNLNIKYIVYDPYNIDVFIKAAERKGVKWDFIELRQDYKNLSPNIKGFRYAVFNKEIIHNDNPVLNRAIYDARVKEFNNNLRIVKEKRTDKIDSLMALFNAFSEAKEYEYAPESISEKIAKGKFSF
ncbi:terminase large subunit [Salinicoccus halitifaciens]|uniref:Phage terminase large subunit-like protein n=1 Tax=Salinicoccus halitifaciens TaxID=1073415 RepID=A0ABV2E5S5_9STAP|nr:terminase TerL endonuclease subunit [Salinicoccus halitifaciens]MCD2137179.1 phage terminase family protein [Salinicoccus halitifaciens]